MLPGRGTAEGVAKSPEGQAISHTLSKREALSATVRMAISRSNRAERSLRGVVLVETTDCSLAAKGRTAAILNGLIAICKRLHIDPFAWNVLARSATTETTAKPKRCFPANRRPSPERTRRTAPGQNGRQHVPLRLFGAVMAVCLGISAQSGVTIQQVKEFIHSAVKEKQPDKQVAAALRTLKLSERLDERTVEELQGEGAGPKTVAALKELAARSAEQLPQYPRHRNPST